MTSWKATFASLRKVIGSEFWSSKSNETPAPEQSAFDIMGTARHVCKFSFAEWYGKLGKGLIHAYHHRQQLAASNGKHVVPPKSVIGKFVAYDPVTCPSDIVADLGRAWYAAIQRLRTPPTIIH